MVIESVGYGAGGRDLDGLPNCTQVVIGSTVRSRGDAALTGQPQMLLEANLDDATGEQVADVLAALFDAGAADAWITPVLMKKGRPGQIVAALCDVALADQIRQVLLSEGGSLGVRATVVDRFASSRSLQEVEIDGHTVRVKVSPGRAKVEHDDASRVAKLLGLPVREVTSRAEAAWRDHLEQHLDD
jgi:uncharacterized protein (DUF111 family)